MHSFIISNVTGLCPVLNKPSSLLLSENVKFIDYEYAGYNYQAYDIGNHFNEFAGECVFWVTLPSANAHWSFY